MLLQLEIMNGTKGKWNTVKLIERLHDYVVAREKSEIKSKPTESSVKSLGITNKPNTNHEQNRGDKKQGFHFDFKRKSGKQGPPPVSSAEALVAGVN